MDKVNRGKDFETQIRRAFNDVPNTFCLRLIDPQNGYAGVRNICDFIVYNQPHIYLIECKCCYGNTLPFSNITENQWNGLKEASSISGVIAGYMVWFIDHDATYFIPAKTMCKLKDAGAKSFHVFNSLTEISAEDWYRIPGKKNRILFYYDMKPFFEEVKSYEQLPM